MVWTVLESFGVSGLSIIGLIVVARYISPEDMGVAAMAQSIVQLINIPVEFLFMDALIRRKNAEEIDFDTAHTVSVFMGIAVSLMCWLSAAPVSHWLNVPQMAPVLAWMGLSVAAMGLGTAITARQRREMDFRALAIRSFAGRLVGVVAGIAIAVMGGGVWSLVAQQVLMTAFATLALWLQCSARPSFRFSYRHFRELASFGKNTVAVVLLNFSTQRVFTLFVGASLSTAAAGYLNLAFRVVDILRDIVTNAVVQLALPMFSRHSDDLAQLRKIYDRAVSFTCAVTFPMFAGLAICAPDFIHIVFGPQWDNAVPYVTLLACLTLVHFIRLYSNSLLTARGYPHLPLVPDAAALSVVLLGMVFWGQFSLQAAAAVWAIRLAASLPVDMYNIRRVVHIGYLQQVRGAFTPILAVAAMAVMLGLLLIPVLAGFVPLVRMALMGFCGAAVYAATLWLLDRHRISELLQFARAGLGRQEPAADRPQQESSPHTALPS